MNDFFLKAACSKTDDTPLFILARVVQRDRGLGLPYELVLPSYAEWPSELALSPYERSAFGSG